MDTFRTRARSRVTLQTRTASDDGYGGRTEVWADTSTVWAVIEPMSSRENYISGQLQSRVDSRLTIRYLAALADTTQAATRRARFGTRLYNAHSVRNLAADMKTEGTAFQQLLCTEGEPS